MPCAPDFKTAKPSWDGAWKSETSLCDKTDLGMKPFWKNYLFAGCLLVVFGLGLFLIQSKWLTHDTFWHSAIGNIASAIVIGGLLSLIQQAVLRKDEEQNLLKLFGISNAIRESGIADIMTDSHDFTYRDMILKSEKLHIIMNDGRHWVETNSPSLEIRFGKEGTLTEMFLVNPESDFCKALALKTGYTLDDLKAKIQLTVRMLNDAYDKSARKGELKIYYLKNYPTHTLFYTEDTIIETPYQTASGRNIVPLFKYYYTKGKTSIGDYLYQDLENVISESKLIIERKERVNHVISPVGGQ